MVEHINETGFRTVIEGGPDLVQKVSCRDHQCRFSQVNPPIGDRGSQVRFTAAAGAGDSEPPVGMIRVLSRMGQRGSERLVPGLTSRRTVRIGIGKCSSPELSKVAMTFKRRIATGLIGTGLLARTRGYLSEVRVRDRYIGRQPAGAIAGSTRWRYRWAGYGNKFTVRSTKLTLGNYPA